MRARTATERKSWPGPVGLLLSLSFVVGCDARPATPPMVRQAQQALVASQGLSLTSTNIGGAALGAVRLDRVSLAGTRLEGVHLVGSIFVGKSGARVLQGRDFIGAQLEGTLTSGETAVVRIDDVSETPVRGELHFYTMSALGPNGWSALCAQPNESVPVTGAWDHREGVRGGGARIRDPGLATFSCRTGAISRCMELGYTSWRDVKNVDSSLLEGDAILQACVRMMRADYCGDGRSWTIHGVLINVFDAVGIQKDTQGWRTEAEWSPEGAVCVAERRMVFRDVEPPPCALPRPHPLGRCGEKSHFAADTLIINELLAPMEL